MTPAQRYRYRSFWLCLLAGLAMLGFTSLAEGFLR